MKKFRPKINTRGSHRQNHIEVEITEDAVSDPYDRTVKFLWPLLHSFNWTILKAPQETSFSDLCNYPFVLITD